MNPRPDLFQPLVLLLRALQALLRAAAPEAFASIAADARARLAVLNALVRRYIYVLAADFAPPKPRAPSTGHGGSASAPDACRESLFSLYEQSRTGSRSLPSENQDPPALQWAMMFEAVRRLAEVLADPARHVRVLARAQYARTGPLLRDLPVPAHIIRRIPPALDMLVLQFDALARPRQWEGLDFDDSWARAPP